MKINADLDNIYIGIDYDNKSDLYIYTSENLYNSPNETGSISTSDGKDSSNSSFARTHDWIPLSGNKTFSIKLSGSTQIVVYYYGYNEEYISYEVITNNGDSGTFTTPSNCKAVRFRFSGAGFVNANCMLVRGSTIPTYKTYVDPQLIVTSDYTGHRTVFNSTDFLKFHRYPIRIGTWYDGSPVYMRIAGQVIERDQNQILYTDVNMEMKQIIDVRGFLTYTENHDGYHFLGSYLNENFYSGIQVRKSSSSPYPWRIIFYGKGYATYSSVCIFTIIYVGTK